MSQRGELKKMIAECVRQGFRHELLGSGHHRFYSPDGKTIVQCSSTTRDGGHWNKFRTEMRKAGYKDRSDPTMSSNIVTMPSGTLGQALVEAMRKPEPPAPAVETVANGKDVRADHRKLPRGIFRQVLRDYFRQHPTEKVGSRQGLSVLRSKGLQSTQANAIQHLAALHNAGFLKRLEPGFYCFAGDDIDVPVTRRVMPKPPEPVIASDESADADERELDEALAALGRIETVVRKHKNVIRQLAALKKLLNGTA